MPLKIPWSTSRNLWINITDPNFSQSIPSSLKDLKDSVGIRIWLDKTKRARLFKVRSEQLGKFYLCPPVFLENILRLLDMLWLQIAMYPTSL